MKTAAASRPFGVYVHWPFCQSKCPYCDFNSHVRDSIDQKRWREAYLRELDCLSDLASGQKVSSIFFGGGTPSLMAPDTVATVIAEVRKCYDAAEDLEITLEANPGSADAGRFQDYRSAGVNRLSLGVQAFDDTALRFLGRRHNLQEALWALELTREIFSRFSFDLIYARPDQSLDQWKAELARALAFEPEHLSLYQLTMEPGTAFHTAWQRGDLLVPDEDKAADLYEFTQEAMEGAGLPAYEISNHAATGAECRHNLIYWQAGDYLGIGPGAHGRLTNPNPLAGVLDIGLSEASEMRIATRQHRAPEVWLQRVEERGQACQELRTLTAQDRLEELLMMGLRLRSGVSRDVFHQEAGASLEETLSHTALSSLEDAGLLIRDSRGLRASATGRQRLNAILNYLLPEAMPVPGIEIG